MVSVHVPNWSNISGQYPTNTCMKTSFLCDVPPVSTSNTFTHPRMHTPFDLSKPIAVGDDSHQALQKFLCREMHAHTHTHTCIMDKMHRKLAVLVWRTQNANCSPLLANLFTALSCNRTTRGTTSKALLLPAANRLAGLRRPAFHASVLWNALPAATRMCIVKKRFIESLPPSMPLM